MHVVPRVGKWGADIEVTLNRHITHFGTPRSLRLYRLTREVSATLENEAIATGENEATQTDWMGDLSGGLGVGQAAGRGRGAASAGGAGSGDRPVDG